MARDFNGSNQHGQVSIDLSAYPTVFVGAFVWLDALAGAGDFDIIWEYTADGGGTSGGFALYYDGSANVLTSHHAGNVGQSLGTRAAPSTGAWIHLIQGSDYSKSSQEATMYYGGVLQSLSYTLDANNTNAGHANSTFNVAARNGSSLRTDGKIERLFIASADPGATAAAALARGVDPIRALGPTLLGYWPLWGNDSPEPDYCGNANITLTNSPAHAAGPSANRPFDGANWWPGAFTAAGAATTTPKLIGGNLIRPNLVRGRLAA